MDNFSKAVPAVLKLFQKVFLETISQEGAKKSFKYIRNYFKVFWRAFHKARASRRIYFLAEGRYFL